MSPLHNKPARASSHDFESGQTKNSGYSSESGSDFEYPPWRAAHSTCSRPAVVAIALGCLLLGLLLGATSRHNGPEQFLLQKRSTGKLPHFLRQPWERQLLPADALARGLGPLGSGQRMVAFVQKLLSGQPVTVVTLGGSVTFGAGATWWGSAYPTLFADWLLKSFPKSNITLHNRAIPAATSGLTSVCAERLVPVDADFVVVEFTLNDPPNEPLGTAARHPPEVLIRKLLSLPRMPAVVVLHHYSWFTPKRGGLEEGRYFHPSTEADFTELARYYDCPSISLRAAVHPLLREQGNGFKLDLTTKDNWEAFEPNGTHAGRLSEYFYADVIHPSDTGHQALADLLIALIQRTTAAVWAPRGNSIIGWPQLAAGAAPRPVAARQATQREAHELPLPPPMQIDVKDGPTSLCLLDEDFKRAIVAHEGFTYKPERPEADTFVGQKWGWSSNVTGSWAELEFDTQDAHARSKDRKSTKSKMTVYLGYVRSWNKMGRGRVECVSGCQCEPSEFDGAWENDVTLQEAHVLQATQHASCRLRVTISNDTSSGGHKVVLKSVMVTPFLFTISGVPEEWQGALAAGRR